MRKQIYVSACFGHINSLGNRALGGFKLVQNFSVSTNQNEKWTEMTGMFHLLSKRLLW